MKTRTMILYALGSQTIAASGFAPINGLKMLSVMPVFHGFGLGIGIHTALIGGACCILVPKFNVSTIFSFTCSPFVTFCISRRMPSQARNASGSEMRRFAESSSVRSSHCVDAVMGAFIASAMI